MNSNLLKYHIAKAGYKIGDMGKLLGISQAAFSNKLNGKTEYTVAEAKTIAETLVLEDADAINIFFDRSVAK